MNLHRVFVTGATGHIGRELIPVLLGRGHQIRTLVRPGSERKAPAGCEMVSADPLQAASYYEKIPPCDTIIHLVGVSHPSPSKADQFRTIDLKSVEQVLSAATNSGLRHLIYISVAQPAPIMKAYVAARAEAEILIGQSGLNATILRPWYVLGPGHRWPVILLPLYYLLEVIPATRDSARRLGLVNTRQMTSALVAAVENPPQGIRIIDVDEIQRSL